MHNAQVMSLLVTLACLTAILVLISVALARWVLRINDIVDRLDRVVDLLAKAFPPAARPR